jgi:hypothetical protein
MGYYENPPIINLNPGADKITAGIMDAADSVSKALIKRGEDRREEEKQRRLSVQKIQEEKNKTDLYYSEKLSDWEIKNPSDNSDISSQIRSLLQNKIKIAADAKIALTMETDPAKREEYLKNITNANKFMDVAAKAGKGFGMEAATYGDTSAIAMNVPGGWAVTGDETKRRDRTSALDIMCKRTGNFESHGVKLIDKGDTFDVEFFGKRKGEDAEFKTSINASDYLNSDDNGNGGLLYKVENTNEFFDDATKTVLDSKSGKIYDNFIAESEQDVNLGNGYQLAKARKLDLEAVRGEIYKKADIKAAGYLKANKPTDMWSLVNWSLGMGEGYYEKVFPRDQAPEIQQAALAKLLTEKAVGNMTKKFRKTNDGQDIWISGEPQRIKAEKAASSTNGGGTSAPKLGAREKSQLEFQREVEKVAKAGKGRVLGPGGWRLDKMDGRWGIFNRQGDQMFGTEGITQPTELATFIGYKKEEKPKLKGK